MRILWVANSPTVFTGYGIQTKYFTRLINSEPTNKVTILANYGVEGSPAVFDGMTILPRAIDIWGNDIVRSHSKFCNAELVITLCDPHILEPDIYQHLPWCSWAPIETYPVFNKNIWALQAASYVWAMSHFGKEALIKEGLREEFIYYVPHGFDNQAFHVIEDRVAARKAFSELIGVDITSSFLITSNGTNRTIPPRKGFFEALYAFKKFSAEHPDAMFYIHTERRGLKGGINFDDLILSLDIDPHKVVFPDQYFYNAGMIKEQFLNLMYNASDVYFHTASAGGFEIPILEAQACGAHVIAPNAPPMNEIILSGTAIDTIPTMGWNHTVWNAINCDAAVDALNQRYAATIDFDSRIKTSLAVAHLEYHKVYEQHMKPALDKIQQEVQPKDQCSSVLYFNGAV